MLNHKPILIIGKHDAIGLSVKFFKPIRIQDPKLKKKVDNSFKYNRIDVIGV